MAFYSISDIADRLLSSPAHPMPSLEEAFWLRLRPPDASGLLSSLLEELSPAAMAAFDLACCHCQLWKTSRQLLDTAERRLNASLEARGTVDGALRLVSLLCPECLSCPQLLICAQEFLLLLHHSSAFHMILSSPQFQGQGCRSRSKAVQGLCLHFCFMVWCIWCHVRYLSCAFYQLSGSLFYFPMGNTVGCFMHQTCLKKKGSQLTVFAGI